MIVSLPIPFVQVAVTTTILTDSVTITPTTIQTTTIPTTTFQHISEPFHELDFTHGFDFDEIFTFPTHQVEASSSRGPDPRDTRITTLETQVASLLETGEKLKELLEKQPPKPSSEEACHLVDLTKGDDQDKDPEAGPSGKPDYSKEAQIEALCNLEEGEIDSGDDWDEEDDDVVIKVPKGDWEGEYEFEDGEIFKVPYFESHLDTGSVEPASTVEASTEASPADPTLVDLEVQKDKHMPASSLLLNTTR
ncbi:hypothetical protein L1987_20738 [Smallanthus sonchifolius]|uniref:Uncharacterized protein n=1 Tax=Smallanthus sonchifolius TaxID=185202 RepID=A0ACB9IU49_9ASTR|nr:hypothetical protein L1987_20738 [Smallanthus sonchifolius]